MSEIRFESAAGKVGQFIPARIGVIALYHVTAEHIPVLIAHGAVEMDVRAAVLLAHNASAGQELDAHG